MQFNQMNTPFYGYNNYRPPLEFNRQIIGEGNVTSLVYPDGTIQHFFVPVSQWCPQMYNPVNPTWSPNVAVWLVRSINIPQLPPNCCQLRQRLPDVLPQEHLSDLSFSKSDTTFKLKFHNDGWTSTTDMVYFYPSLRSSSRLPESQCKGSAAIQVELAPWTICHCDTVQQSCRCAQKEPKWHTRDIEHGHGHTGDEAVTNMSIDDINSKYESDKKNTPKQCLKKCYCNGIRNKSKNKVICQCGDLPKSNTENKLVSTFADQATNCLDKCERLTQTLKSNSSSTPSFGSNHVMKLKSQVSRSSSAKKSLISKGSEKSLHLSTCSSECSCYDEN